MILNFKWIQSILNKEINKMTTCSSTAMATSRCELKIIEKDENNKQINKYKNNTGYMFIQNPHTWMTCFDCEYCHTELCQPVLLCLPWTLSHSPCLVCSTNTSKFCPSSYLEWNRTRGPWAISLSWETFPSNKRTWAKLWFYKQIKSVIISPWKRMWPFIWTN